MTRPALFTLLLLTGAGAACEAPIEARAPAPPQERTVASDYGKEVWFSPSFASVDYAEMFAPHRRGQWDEVRDDFDVFKFHLIHGSHGSGAPHEHFDPQDLDWFLGWLQANGKEVAIELGGPIAEQCNRANNGVHSANEEFALMAHIVAAGYTIDHLVIDGPMSRTLHGGRQGAACANGPDQAVNNFVAYLQQMRNHLPETKFTLLVNFPNWAYGGRPGSNANWGGGVDYSNLLGNAVATARNAGVPIHGLQIDQPWKFLGGSTPSLDDHARLAGLIDQAFGLGLAVTYIANTDDPGFHPAPGEFFPNTTTPKDVGGAIIPWTPQLHGVRDAQFRHESLRAVDFALTQHADKLAGIVLQSWHSSPYETFGGHAHNMQDILERGSEIARRGLCTREAYLDRVPGLGNVPQQQALEHWINHGFSEGLCEPRMPSAPPQTCTAAEYAALRPDVNPAQIAQHYVGSGQFEGMCNPLNGAGFCTPEAYAQAVPGLAAHGLTPQQHYLNHGRFENRCAPFGGDPGTCSPQEYFARRPDLAGLGITADAHYLVSGAWEGMCDPRALTFCTPEEYLGRYPDVLVSGQTAEAHYEASGKQEGRCNPSLRSRPKDWWSF